MPEEVELDESSGKWLSGQAAIAKALSALLQRAWLTHIQPLVSLSYSCDKDYSLVVFLIFYSLFFLFHNSKEGNKGSLLYSRFFVPWIDPFKYSFIIYICEFGFAFALIHQLIGSLMQLISLI